MYVLGIADSVALLRAKTGKKTGNLDTQQTQTVGKKTGEMDTQQTQTVNTPYTQPPTD